jgi:hypothetical protein
MPFQRRFNILYFSILVSVVLTNPLDLVATKMCTQQYDKYTSLVQALKTVHKEETALKLWFGGSWARFAYYAVTASLVQDFQAHFKQTMQDAFNF